MKSELGKSEIPLMNVTAEFVVASPFSAADAIETRGFLKCPQEMDSREEKIKVKIPF